MPRRAGPRDERGFSLMEALVAAVIAVIAVVGLAHTFGLGRGLINRYEVARAAMGVAQRRIELLMAEPPGSAALAIPMGQDSVSASQPFAYHAMTVGTETWTVYWRHDAIDPDPVGKSMKFARVTVSWRLGADGDYVRLERLFPAY